MIRSKMPFSKGALVYVNYTAKVKDTGEPIETTVEDQAKKLDIYDGDRRYEPRLVSVGEDWVLKGLDEEIAKMDVGIAVIRFIGSGRAQVDFNHRLAGKTLIYEIEALRKVEPGEDTIRSLMKRRFPGEGEKMEFLQDAGEGGVTIPEEAFLVDGLQIIKRCIANDILHFVPEAKKVTFTEAYPRKDAGREKAKPAQAEAATQAQPETAKTQEKREEKQTA